MLVLQKEQASGQATAATRHADNVCFSVSDRQLEDKPDVLPLQRPSL